MEAHQTASLTASKKRLDNLLVAHGTVAAVSGLLAVVFPHLFAVFFGEEWDGHFRYNPSDDHVKIAHVVIRLYGVLIFGQALLVYAARGVDDGIFRRRLVKAYFTIFSMTTLVLLRSHFTDDHWHLYNWLNILLFLALSGFYGWFAFFQPPPVFENVRKMLV